MNMYVCQKPGAAEPMPTAYAPMVELSGQALAFPSHSRDRGTINGGGYEWSDVAKTLSLLDSIIPAIVETHGQEVRILLDLEECPPVTPAGHAYVASVIDRIRVLAKGAKVGLRDSEHCADLVDFVAPWLGVRLPVGLAPGWADPSETRAMLGKYVVQFAGLGKPMVCLIDAQYSVPGMLQTLEVGEWELSTAVELAAAVPADIALCLVDGSVGDVAKRIAAMIDPQVKRGSSTVPAALL